MSDNEPISMQPTDVLPDASGTAEAKRRAARRRFLGRSAATGSGLVIVTLLHTRAFAVNPATAHLVSTVAACTSIGGQVETTGGHVKMYDNSVTGAANTRFNCIRN